MPTLYDAYNRPIRTQELTREHAAPSLTGVRTIWTETVAGGLTPVRLANVLRDAADGDHESYLTLAEEMEERDLHYACELGKRKLAVSRLPITVEAYSDEPRDIELADAVRALVRRPQTRPLLKDLLDGLGKGFSVAEIMWDRSGKRWEPAQYIHRDPRWFVFDRASMSTVRLRDPADMIDGVELAPYKFAVHFPRLKTGIPIRGGIARVAAWAWMCKGYSIKDWLAFAEVFGMPLRLGKYEAGADEADKAVLRMAVANLGTDAAAVFPKSMEIELVEAAGKAAAADFFRMLADYLDAQISRGILGQTATTVGTPGKLGSEDAQAEVREDIRDDDAEQLAATLQRDLVQPYIDLNFGPQENYPRLVLAAQRPENVEALSNALSRLVPLGLQVEQSVIRDKLGLPDPDENAKPEDLLSGPAGGNGAGFDFGFNRAGGATDLLMAAMRQMAGADRVAAANREGAADEDDIDALVADELADWEPLMAPITDPVAALVDDAVAAGQDIETLRGRLAELLETQDPAALVDALAAAMLKARGMGDATDEV